jgi:hypothetical protein
MHKDTVVSSWVARQDFDSHGSSDCTLRISSAARKEMAPMVSTGNLEHGPRLILTGHTAVIAYSNGNAPLGYDLFFGDLEHAVRHGRRKVIFSYLLHGNTQTSWLCYRLKSTTSNTNSSPINLDDPSARYVRCSAPDLDNTLTIPGNDNMLPILCGVDTDAFAQCDRSKCCGKCFTATPDLLAELRRILTEIADR